MKIIWGSKVGDNHVYSFFFNITKKGKNMNFVTFELLGLYCFQNRKKFTLNSLLILFVQLNNHCDI